MGKERRKDPRVSIPLDGRWLGSSGGSPCQIENISLGGCYVQTAESSVQGHGVVMLDFGRQGSLSIAGRVVHAEQGLGFGVRFRDMAPELRVELRGHLKALRSVRVA
jgi:hypothetical protein